jgi:hypothetical protein
VLWDRAIDIIDAVLPIVAQSDQDALEIVEVILAGHQLPEFSPAQSTGFESACA